MKVGLGTSSSGSPAAARIRARARKDLPAPRSPASRTMSPGRSSAASRAARAAVAASSGRSRVNRNIGRLFAYRGRCVTPASHRDGAPGRGTGYPIGVWSSGEPPCRPHRTDVAIIGAGPVGLFAVFECGMLKMRCHVIDVLDVQGGQCAALYPEKPIYDIPGHPRIEAAELIDRLVEQAAPFAPVYHLGQRVETLTRRPDGRWLVGTSDRHADRRRGGDRRRRGRRLRPEPAAAGRDRGTMRAGSVFYMVTRQGGAARQARGDRRRRRLRARLGDPAGRHRRQGHGGAPARQVPRRAGKRRQAARAGRGRQDRAGRCPTSCTGWKGRAASSPPSPWRRSTARCGGSTPTCCCRSSACR